MLYPSSLFLLAYICFHILCMFPPCYHELFTTSSHLIRWSPRTYDSICICFAFVWIVHESRKQDTALIAALDGTVHLVESNSRKVLWSFSSGPPIYSSYQAPTNKDGDKENASGLSNDFFVDCGDDWELYMHTHDFGKMVSWTLTYTCHTMLFLIDSLLSWYGKTAGTIYSTLTITEAVLVNCQFIECSLFTSRNTKMLNQKSKQ